MRNLLRRIMRNRRGSMLAVVVVFLPATLGTMALAIDLSMLFQARIQAQRAADSAALAGASAYLDFTPAANAVASADTRAREYAGRNDIRGTFIDPVNEVTVQVRPAQYQVYVHVRRQNIPTWFARFLGFPTGNVAADAVAEATGAGGVKCLSPLAVFDYHHEADTDDGDRVLEPNEDWQFNPRPGGDYYNRADVQDPNNLTPNPDGNPDTGYGSGHRNPPYGTGDGTMYDNGRTLVLKPQDPQDAVKPGYFQALVLPNSINAGASGWQENFRTCNPSVINVGDSLEIKTGDMRGPTRVIMNELFNADPFARYDPVSKTVQNSSYGANWLDSPRVLLLALLSPYEIELMQGRSYWPDAIDFAYYFLETPPASIQDPVVGRFMYYASGVGGEGPTGQLTRVIRLVQ